jgi:hypothetical protein
MQTKCGGRKKYGNSMMGHGETLAAIRDERTQRVHIVMRELCERLGIDWTAQYTKLTSTALYKDVLRCWAIPTPGGTREVILLDVDMLPNWLLSISVNRVRTDVQGKLIAYQKECAKALRDY